MSDGDARRSPATDGSNHSGCSLANQISSDEEASLASYGQKSNSSPLSVPKQRHRRMKSIDSDEAAIPDDDPRYNSHASIKQEVYLDQDGNVVYADETSITDRVDADSEIGRLGAGNTSPKTKYVSNSSNLGLEFQLAALDDVKIAQKLSVNVAGHAGETSRLPRPSAKRTKPRKHLSLGDRLARLPGASNGRYQDRSADFTSVVGDDAATFVITSCGLDLPTLTQRPSPEPSECESNDVCSEADSSLANFNQGTGSGHFETSKPSGTTPPPPILPVKPIESRISQFQAIVLSFLANEGKVSAAHATRVVSESVNLVPDNGDIYIFDYDGHIVQVLPDSLVAELGLTAIDSDLSRYHLNETKKIMWRLGHATENGGKAIQAWIGKARKA